MALVGIARMPGTCGELVQGTLDGVPFHVSCPVDMYAEAEVSLHPLERLDYPCGCSKAGAAVRKTLDLLGYSQLGGKLLLRSPIPRSKGMASSTADIAAAISATVQAVGAGLNPQQIAQIALSIEPTDGSIFPGVVLFDHRFGMLYESLGSPPPVDIVVLDFGGEVDTVSFNKADRSALLAKLEPQVREALALVRTGIAEGDPLLVGRGATLSARANQEVLFKPQLETVIVLAREAGALGVNVGHSGTVIGVLVDHRTGDARAAHRFILDRLGHVAQSFLCSLVGGGSVAARKVEGDGEFRPVSV